MFNYIFYFILSFFVGLVLFLLNFVSFKNFFKNEMIYSIESGFLSYKKSFFFFNLNFYVILLLFILFDIELIFVIFFPYLNFFYLEIFFIFFFIFFTLYVEWYFGKMMWY